MEITIFASRKVTQEGKPYYIYIGAIKRKDGEMETMRVKFRACDAPKPETCPRNIRFERVNANIAEKRYIDKGGVERMGKTLWVSAWDAGDVYIDHSLDDYE